MSAGSALRMKKNEAKTLRNVAVLFLPATGGKRDVRRLREDVDEVGGTHG